MSRYSCLPGSSPPASGLKFTRVGTQVTVLDRLSSGKPRASRRKLSRAEAWPRLRVCPGARSEACPKPKVEQVFKRKPNKSLKIDTLIGAGTRINGDVEFSGGLHLDGYINGNVSGEPQAGAILSVSEQGGIEGSVNVPNVILNGIVKGDIDATLRVELGEKARVLGNVRYSSIETAVGAQINGKLIHRTSVKSAESEAGPVADPQL
jgi:cytoskeletal protein CcmA (bactofilin family)